MKDYASLPVSHQLALIYVADEGHASMADIADGMQWAKLKTFRVVNTLIESGMLCEFGRATIGKVAEYQLTKAAEAQMNSC